MSKEKFNELIERAKQCSKDDFLRFVSGIYGVDECVFDHMWDVPVIAPYEGDTLVTTSLSTKTEDELLDIVDEFIASELEDAEGGFVFLDKMVAKFTNEESEEWQNKLDSGELKYNAIIVYNKLKLQKQYRELIKVNSENVQPKTQEELDQIFVDYVKDVITHERCRLNANYLVTEVRNSQFVLNVKSSSEISSWRQNDIIIRKRSSKVEGVDYFDRNKVLIDILGQMMSNYQEWDSVEDCLFRIIEDRKGKSQYKTLDDKEVLTMYVLFSEELTEWATFGAYDFVRENKLQNMIMKVCGTDMLLTPEQLKKKVESYVATLKEGSLSYKQIQMLEMLNFSISKIISKEDMKEVATYEKALSSLSENVLDEKLLTKSMQMVEYKEQKWYQKVFTRILKIFNKSQKISCKI